MSTMVKVTVCAECLQFCAGKCDIETLGAQRKREISDGFGQWTEYEFTFGRCSERDLMNGTVCGICRNSLTKDRRHHDEHNVALDRRVTQNADRHGLSQDRRRHNESNDAWDRRWLSDSDRRTPFSRGCSTLLATLRTS
jgi:hypothetical protein